LAEASDDWSVGKLDVGAYLRRIDYPGPVEATGDSLVVLYKAHLRTVPFENFDIFMRGGVSVDLESIQDKIVFRGRGGYCYEQAQLFGAVLERLGFGVERLLARVGPDGGPADPGFGSSPPAPLSLTRSGGPQAVGDYAYEVTPGTEHGQEVWKLREYQAGQWVTLHRWDDAKVQPIDVVLSNHYTSTHPDSWFTWQPLVVKRDPDAIRSILGRTYTVTRPGQEKQRRDLTDQEFAAALTGEFALKLSKDELAALVAAPTGRDKPSMTGVAPGT
jgi:N-hydroxyarylamine O-acetyltransferase